jgi:hypothetical protein
MTEVPQSWGAQTWGPDPGRAAAGMQPGDLSYGEVQQDWTAPAAQVAGADTLGWEFEAELDHMLRRAAGEEPPPRAARTATHRRVRAPKLRSSRWWMPVVSFLTAATSGAILGTVSILSSMVSYPMLRTVALPTAHHWAVVWPVFVYGPWVAATISLVHRDRGRMRHLRLAWVVLLGFSSIAVALCVMEAPKTPAGIATAALPPIAALTCLRMFLPLVVPARGQHAIPHPRTAKPAETA